MKALKMWIVAPLLITLMFIFQACPYESTFPLEGNKVKYDTTLLGKWTSGKDEITITRVDDYQLSYVNHPLDAVGEAQDSKGTGTFIKKDNRTFMLTQISNTGRYLVFLLDGITNAEVKMIPLEETQLKGKRFGSATDFSNYVFNEAKFHPGSVATYVRAK